MPELEAPEPQAPEAPQPAAAPTPDPKAELDANFAAAFAEIDLGGDDEPASDDAPERTSDEPAPKPINGERKEGEIEVPPEEDAEEYEKALLALRYTYGKGAALIIKNASRDELIALGTEAADKRAKTEAALEERALRIRELEEGQKAPAAAPAKAAAPDWTPHLKALADTLGLEPEAASKAFGPMLDAVAQQVRAEFEGRLSPIEQRSRESQAAEGRRQISEQVRRLSETYPKLKSDQDLVTKLNAKALSLWKSGDYRDPESVYDDASRLVLGDIPRADLASKRRNGARPDPGDSLPDRSMDSDDAFMTALERVEAGDMRGAKRAGASVSWGPSERRRATR